MVTMYALCGRPPNSLLTIGNGAAVVSSLESRFGNFLRTSEELLQFSSLTQALSLMLTMKEMRGINTKYLSAHFLCFFLGGGGGGVEALTGWWRGWPWGLVVWNIRVAP